MVPLYMLLYLRISLKEQYIFFFVTSLPFSFSEHCNTGQHVITVHRIKCTILDKEISSLNRALSQQEVKKREENASLFDFGVTQSWVTLWCLSSSKTWTSFAKPFVLALLLGRLKQIAHMSVARQQDDIVVQSYICMLPSLHPELRKGGTEREGGVGGKKEGRK